MGDELELDINDRVYMNATRAVAQLSPNLSRKTGCVLVPLGWKGHHISGCNTFPMNVHSTKERLETALRYVYIEHAERMAIYNAARLGVALDGCTAYANWYPCADCARALVEVGCARLVAVEPDWTELRYGFLDAKAILEEGGVQVSYLLI